MKYEDITPDSSVEKFRKFMEPRELDYHGNAEGKRQATTYAQMMWSMKIGNEQMKQSRRLVTATWALAIATTIMMIVNMVTTGGTSAELTEVAHIAPPHSSPSQLSPQTK